MAFTFLYLFSFAILINFGISSGLSLMIILDKGMTNAKIESDKCENSVAVKFLNEGPPPDRPQRLLMEAARSIATRTNTSITHIYRQANQTTDCLARLGSQQEDSIVTINVPHTTREFVIADSLGVGHNRT